MERRPVAYASVELLVKKDVRRVQMEGLTVVFFPLVQSGHASGNLEGDTVWLQQTDGWLTGGGNSSSRSRERE
jgi:hypothetical protein